MTRIPSPTNREDWDWTFEIVDDDTDSPIDLATLTAMTFELRDPYTKCSVLTAELDDGLTVTDEAGGVITLHVDKANMRDLDPKSYEFGIVGTIGGATKQFAEDTIIIRDGIVSR